MAVWLLFRAQSRAVSFPPIAPGNTSPVREGNVRPKAGYRQEHLNEREMVGRRGNVEDGGTAAVEW